MTTSGTAFVYSATVHSTGDFKPHETMDPKGVTFRESRDSVEHPVSQAVAVIFDVTGSMAGIPVQLQKKLPDLFGLLLRKGYVADPQVLFGAIGDATCDRVPLQIGQFESDNRSDECLENIVLEGGGGGQMTESYELAMYFMARHTSIDCMERRGKKGYLFFIGDEMAYPKVRRREVTDHIGDGLEADIPLQAIVDELCEKYEVYYILPKAASHGGNPEVLSFWRNLFGQNVLQLDDVDAVSETIALTIGLAEGTIDLDDGVDHLRELKIGAGSIASASKAVATVAENRAAVATASGSLGDLGSGGADRL